MWKFYKRLNLQEMRPYIPGEDLSKIRIFEGDIPEKGGMIRRDVHNHKDQWYIRKIFFEENYEKV